MNMSHGQLSTLPVSDTLRLLASLLSGRGMLMYDSKKNISSIKTESHL